MAFAPVSYLYSLELHGFPAFPLVGAWGLEGLLDVSPEFALERGVIAFGLVALLDVVPVHL